jgi:hypothetical protein
VQELNTLSQTSFLPPEILGIIIGGVIGILGAVIGAIVTHRLTVRLREEEQRYQRQQELRSRLVAGAAEAATKDAESRFPFSGRGALHFPSTPTEEELIQALRDLLALGHTSEEEWKQTTELVVSFLDWLRFRLRD